MVFMEQQKIYPIHGVVVDPSRFQTTKRHKIFEKFLVSGKVSESVFIGKEM